MRNKRFSPLQMITAVVLTLVLTLGAVAGGFWLLAGKGGISLLESLVLINSSFVGDYDRDEMIDTTLSSMISALGDRWSYYLDQESYVEQQERRNNSYVGIGVTVSYEREEGLFIEGVTEGGAGEQAGLQAGEIIVAVDGVSVAGEARYNGAELISGTVGTQVELEIMSAAGELRTVSVTRTAIYTDPVAYQLVDGHIGLITISNFYSGSADAMIAAVEDLIAQGADSLLFDLRNNPGGYLSELETMLDYLLPEGTIFISEDVNGNRTYATSDADCIDLPMASVVNAKSYSAAEFFAAQLQETLNAPVVGEVTSGKGYSQNTFPLANGGAIGISTKRYYTGGGVSLIGTGITPDAEVTLSEEDYTAHLQGTLSVEEDTQLQAAIALLNEE